MATSRSAGDGNQLFIPGLRAPKEVFRSLRNYLAGQFVGATRDDALLDEVLKCLFCKLYVETGAAKIVPAGADSFEQARHIRSVFASVREDFPGIYEPQTEILLDPEAVSVVTRECVFSLLDPSSDAIGDAFEVFVGSESRGRSGQFFTPQVVTDFLVRAVAPEPGEKIIDPACGAGGFLTSVARYFAANGVTKKRLATLTGSTFYGVDKDSYLAKLAKLHISLLTRGHPRISCSDSIAWQNGSARLGEEFPSGGFDVLLTNPPFGTRIVAAKPEVLRTFDLARKWRLDKESGKWEPSAEMQNQVPPQILFVERCLSLLKNGGRMGMVVPESLLSNKSYRYVVEYLLSHSYVRAVIGMPESLFKTSGKGGTHTKTCLLIAEKKGANAREPKRVFMAEARWCGHDSRARTIPKNDLPSIAENLECFTKKRRFIASTLGFTIERGRVAANVLCPRYYDPQVDAELKGLEQTHLLLAFGQLVSDGVLSVSTGDELGKLAYGTGDIPFIRTSDISNWELKADPKHSVARTYLEELRGKQDVRSEDILMVKDGTYLIGTCAIVTEYDTEILYQSHLYKIRTNENSFGLNPFLLLAILSSRVVQRQIRAKQFTQDIIDSLGERIHELILPVPKSKKTREKVTDMVRTTIRDRIEARELAKEARVLVAQ